MTQKDRKDVIKILYDSGITSPTEICRRTYIPRMTVFRTLKLILENKSLQHKQGAGRPSTITFLQKQSLITTLKRSPTMSIRNLRGKLAATYPNAPLTTTVRGSFITPLTAEKRVVWAKNNLKQNWEIVIFTDECSVWLF